MKRSMVYLTGNLAWKTIEMIRRTAHLPVGVKLHCVEWLSFLVVSPELEFVPGSATVVFEVIQEETALFCCHGENKWPGW